ncbi:MAG TPA: hypothetical protein VFI29_20220 [Hanamia sp.]|nr:hypothetical protein [Hanamia sp.]
MKKSLFTVLCASILFSCTQGTNNSGPHSKDNHSTVADTSLTLNNGAKWKADSITNHNVIRLKVTANMFRVKPYPELDTYQLLGSDLANDADTMLQQCRMKGADHEALHKWLGPIINQSGRLKNVTDTAEGRKIFDFIDRRINEYQQYFE